ncbi:MAG: leucine-rich repeat domain-containing protein, partial [Coriobacteriales bacterium]
MALSDALVSLDGMTATFGGFGPTPQKDVSKTVEEVMTAYERMTKLREDRLAYFAHQEELTSEERDFTDDDGTTWHYVLFDQTEVRITGFETEAPRVVVPSQIEDTPVFAIVPDGCAHNHTVEEIVCADCIQTIGASAFRDSTRLRRLVLPRFTASFDRTWIQSCPHLEELVLPGMLERVDAGVFENTGLRVLAVGINASEFAPGMFEKGDLDRIEIDEDNPHFVTDGEAVLSRDGREYVALAVNCRSYEVPAGVAHLAKKAFQGMSDLEEVVLPEGLETIGDYAFCRTALAELVVPDSVTTIGERACFKAKALRRIALGAGVATIGVDAFTDTALEELRIPASIRELAYPLVNHTGLSCAGNDATFTIAPDSDVLFFDEAGGLYRREDDGLHFVKMFEQDVVEYEVLPSTTFIDAQAFLNYLTLETVSIPDSVVEIGRAAFSGCKKLHAVRLGNSVRTIGMDAFLDTSLERLRIPASVQS